ncbi:hypothetical protein ACFXC8_46520 [Streptomyces sp. NPDC059441]|uniref:hypothetical protein n=1 Tax=Streptomyces sp. NPDC059441 TaxID=3346829 RepID=UPI003698AFAC
MSGYGRKPARPRGGWPGRRSTPPPPRTSCCGCSPTVRWRDPDPAVRAAAARHPNLPRARLTELLDFEELAHPAAANPALDVATIRWLSRTLEDPAGSSVDTPA